MPVGRPPAALADIQSGHIALDGAVSAFEGILLAVGTILIVFLIVAYFANSKEIPK